MREFSVSDVANGAMVFWSTGPSRREYIEHGLGLLGLEEFKPQETTDASALRGAAKALLEETMCGKNRSPAVVPLKDTKINGVEASVFKHGDTANDYLQVFTAKVVDSRIKITSGDASEYQLNETFQRLKATCSGASVSGMLVRVIAHMKGVTLRESGGLYYLPDSVVNTFRALANVVEGAACGESKNVVYSVRTVLDGQSVRAVRDAIVKEINETTAEIITEVSGNMGPDALERRKQRAIALHEKITMYEEVLGVALDVLHGSVASAEKVMCRIEMEQMSET